MKEKTPKPVESEEVVRLNKPQRAFDYENGQKILEVKHLKQYFRFGRGYLKAVHDVSFDVYKGEVFGLVGESGCGKTTTGRSIIKLYRITSGDVWFKGVRIAAGTRWNEKEIKYSKIRLSKELKDLKAKEKEELATLIANRTNELNNTSDSSAKNEINTRYSTQIKEVKAKYKTLREEAIAPVEKIVATERENIKKAVHDQKHCNDDIAKAEVKRVKEKYNYLLKETNPKSHPDYAKYKEELKEAKNASITRSIQMIFQDPIASLNPRMTIRNIIAEGLIIRGIKDNEFIDKEVNKVLEMVGLLPEHANRYPHEFSGGQRQRIGIARAIIMHPELIIADEPVSALDVSIQAQVINLLNDLRNELGLTIVFIAHNLSVVKYFCDRIAVMYYGELMEVATSDELFKHPLHPYTKSLLSAVPCPDPNIERGRKRIVYHPDKDHDYSKQGPSLHEIVPGHFVRCNDEELARYLEEIKEK